MANVGRVALGTVKPSAATSLSRQASYFARVATLAGGGRLQSVSTPQKRSPGDLSGVGPSPWGDELDLQEIYGKAKACRIRQHINPLRAEFQVPKEAPEWRQIYADCSLPLVVDIGCAGGRFALALADKMHSHNFLGLDIRSPLLKRANEWANALGIDDRVYFDKANATVSLESMLSSYPGSIQLATVQFPDPHFKKRHKKRRIVQPQLIAALAKLMAPQGRVFLQSDVHAVTATMRDEFEMHGSEHFALAPEHEDVSMCSHYIPSQADAESLHNRPDLPNEAKEDAASSDPSDAFPVRRDCSSSAGSISGIDDLNPPSQERRWAKAGYLKQNPLSVPTEREVQTLKRLDPVYRVLLVRK